MMKLDKSILSRWEVSLLVFIIIVSLVIAGSYATYAIMFAAQDPASAEPSVESGDTVSVDYIGMFEDGTVFDTSIQSVAENNTMYPKSPFYSARQDYAPLSFTVGSGQMISGFEKGVVGMSLNQTRVLTLTPELAYGSSNASLFETRPLTQSVPVYEWFGNSSYFRDTFGTDPEIGANIKNLEYGWNMTVFHIDTLGDKVMIRNNPFPGETLKTLNGWYSKVVSIDSSADSGSGEIVIRHIISSGDIGTKAFSDEYGNQCTISAIDTVAGTFTIDFNREVVGKTLIFKITLISLTPAA